MREENRKSSSPVWGTKEDPNEVFGSRNDLEGFPSKHGEGLGSFLKPATLETRTKARGSMPGLAHLPSCPSHVFFLEQPARSLQDIHHVISSIPALGINSAAHSG